MSGPYVNIGVKNKTNQLFKYLKKPELYAQSTCKLRDEVRDFMLNRKNHLPILYI